MLGLGNADLKSAFGVAPVVDKLRTLAELDPETMEVLSL